MLVEKIDHIDLEPLKRGLCDLFNALGPAVKTIAALPLRVNIESKLSGDDHLFSERRKRLTHELFVNERPVDLGRVEKRYAAFYGRPNEGDHLLLVRRRPVTEAHPHAAQTQSRNFQVILSQFSLLHNASLMPLIL